LANGFLALNSNPFGEYRLPPLLVQPPSSSWDLLWYSNQMQMHYQLMSVTR